MQHEHLTAVQIHAYAARSASPKEALEVSEHLVTCSECRAIVRQTEALRRGREVEPHLSVSYEELAALVDDELDPFARREIMEQVRRSTRATAELIDLANFKNEVANAVREKPPRHFRSSSGTWLAIAAAVVAALVFVWWNTTLQPPEGVLVLRDNGRRLQIARDGAVLNSRGFPPELESSLKSALTDNQIDVPSFVKTLTGTRGNLAGDASTDSTLRAIAPLGTAVEDPSPELRWNGDDRATSYRVTIIARGADEPWQIAEVPKNQTAWQPGKPLVPGETYSWQVQALRDGGAIATAPAPPEPEAQFRVLSTDERGELNRIKARVARSHLALALAEARFGVLDKADAELAELERENHNSPLPGQLRAALRNSVAQP